MENVQYNKMQNEHSTVQFDELSSYIFSKKSSIG